MKRPWMKCSDCKFSDKTSDPMQIGKVAYVCVKNPPIAAVVQGMTQAGPQTMTMGIFPPVSGDSFCWEWIGKLHEEVAQ